MEWVARAVGAFYIFAGVVVINAARQDDFLDRAIAQISGEKPDPAERLQTTILLGVAVLTLCSGLLLVLLSRWAAAAFVLNALLQAGYLLWARTNRPPQDALEARSRRQTTNAFVIYLVATAMVLGLFQAAVLT